MSARKDRFPGLKSFEKNEAELFFGRDTEILRLSKMITNNRVNLVYGSSGVGKSSLLNTIFRKSEPLLDYIPIRIRLSPQHLSSLEKETILPHLRIIKGRLHKKLQAYGIDLMANLPPEHEESFKLWDYLKWAENKLAEKDIRKTIVLIFDQFEELFTYFKEDKEEFIQQLSEVTHNLLPGRVLLSARSMPFSERLSLPKNQFTQPNVRILFSIRSDKYYLLKEIAGYVPSLYDNQLELKLFNEQNATKAILGPCHLSNDTLKFNSPPISIDPAVISAIVTGLSDLRGIDLSFLQIICYYIEDSIKNKIKDNNGQTIESLLTPTFHFTEEIFKSEIQIDYILDSFYTFQLLKITDPEKRSLVQHALEDELVSGGQRTILVENQFLEAIGDDKEMIVFLLNSRLIRTEFTPDGRKTYELSHDKLIAAVQKSKTMRIGQEKLEQEALEAQIRYLEQVKLLENEYKAKKKEHRHRVVLTYIAIVALLGVTVMAYLYIQLRRTININVENQAQSFFSQNNHYMAFDLWDTYSHQFISTYKKDTIDRLISDTLFYDVSGGENIIALGRKKWAVHNKNNTISLWTANNTFDDLDHTLIPAAINMEVSDDREYLAYRNAVTGCIIVYNIRKSTFSTIKNSQSESFVQRRKLKTLGRNDLPVDYKMGFIKNTGLLSYVDPKGYSFIFDPESNRSVKINALTKFKYISQDIPEIFHFSKGMRFLSIKKDVFELYEWDIHQAPRFVRKKSDVKYFYNSPLRDTLIYLSDNGTIVIEPYNQGSDKNTFRPFQRLKDVMISPDGTKALIQTMKNKLVVYNFNTRKIYSYIDGDKLFAAYHRERRFPALKTICKWADAGSRFSLRNPDGRILLQDTREAQPFVVCDENLNCNYLSNTDGFRYVISANARLSAYVNKRGWLHIYNIPGRKELDSIRIMPDSIAKGKGGVNLESYYLDDIIKFSPDGNSIAYIKDFYTSQGTLETRNLSLRKLINIQHYVKKLGEYFTADYIQVINDYNVSGGLFFLNNKKRDAQYYRHIYPELKAEEKRALGIDLL